MPLGHAGRRGKRRLDVQPTPRTAIRRKIGIAGIGRWSAITVQSILGVIKVEQVARPEI